MGGNIFDLQGNYVDNIGRDFEEEVERLLTPAVDKLFKSGYNRWQVELLLKNSISGLAFYVDLDNMYPHKTSKDVAIILDDGPEPEEDWYGKW